MPKSQNQDAPMETRSESSEDPIALTPSSGCSEAHNEVPASFKEIIADFRNQVIDLPNIVYNHVEQAPEDPSKDTSHAVKKSAPPKRKKRPRYNKQTNKLKKRADEQAALLQGIQEEKDKLEAMIGRLEREKDEFEANLESRLQSQLEARFLELNDAFEKETSTQFHPGQVGFFAPELCGEESEFSDWAAGRTVSDRVFMFYRDVELFIEAAQVATRKVPVHVLRENLHECLTGSARIWWISVLTRGERDEVAKGVGLSNWTTLLRKKWGWDKSLVGFTKSALDDLSRMRLTRESIENKSSTMEFVLAAVRAARRIGMDTTYSQLVLAYMRIEPELQISPPLRQETLNDFIIRTDSTLQSFGYMQRRPNPEEDDCRSEVGEDESAPDEDE